MPIRAGFSRFRKEMLERELETIQELLPILGVEKVILTGDMVSEDYHRAAPGGSGSVKAIGNYAPGMMPSKNAKKEGFAEVIYLDAVHHRYVEEVGAANFFCVKDGVIHTPELTGTILPGITRASIIDLARHFGYEVIEEKVDIDFVLKADECFCAGTAAVADAIPQLIEAGHADRILLSQDVCTKMQLKAYGGTGYSFILERFLPEMRSRGVSEEHIEMMMVQNPARVLTFAEPKN